MREPRVFHPKETQERIATLIKQHVPAIPGIHPNDAERLNEYLDEYAGFDSVRNYVSVRWEQGWAIGCDLTVTTRWGTIEELSDGRMLQRFEIHVQVTWSSTGRDIPNALAAIALYERVTKLGALIQAVANERSLGIIRKRGEKIA